MNAWRVICIALFTAASGLLAARAQPAGPPADQTLSDNGKYLLELSGFEMRNPLLAVLSKDGAGSKLVWSRSLPRPANAEDVNLGWQPGPNDLLKFVSGDGTTVLLLPRSLYGGSQAAVEVFTQKGADARFELSEFFAAADADPPDYSHPELSMLPLMPAGDNAPPLALWLANGDKWMLLDPEKKTARSAPPELLPRLNELALAQCRELARKDQPNRVREIIETARHKAARFLPAGMQPSPERRPEAIRTETAYRFLAARKNPEDRPFLERLLEAKITSAFGMNNMDGVPYAAAISPERTLADELLARWDGQGDPEEDPEVPSGIWIGSRQKLHRFGRIFGTVHLPFEAPDNSGSIWIYLIPASVPVNEWRDHPDLLLKASGSFSFRGLFPPARAAADQDRPDRMHFAFDIITPGEYRLKAVWDRRSSVSPRFPSAAIGLPEPGDYESAESAPLRIEAGSPLHHPVLVCTNFVGPAEEYLAADNLWKSRHPATRDDDEPVPVARPARTLFSAPASDWLIATNENPLNLRLTRIRLLEEVEFQTGETNRTLTVEFIGPAQTNREASPFFEATLHDEDGCSYGTQGSSSQERRYELTFNIVPYASRAWRLTFTYQDNARVGLNGPLKINAGSFRLRNLLKIQPENWTPDSMPAKRDLGGVTVELAKFNPAAIEQSLFSQVNRLYPPGSEPAANEFRFSKEGRPVTAWRKLSAYYSDRWGNKSSDLNQFCQLEKIFKLTVQFAREADRTNFSADEIWEVPLPKVPGPGEVIPLNLSNTLQGVKIKVMSVAGPGEFTYKSGIPVSAASQSGRSDFAARFLPHTRTVEPKLALRDHPLSPGSRYGPQPVKTRTVRISARAPHLSCSIPARPGMALAGLLEYDVSVPDPMNPPPDQRFGYFGPAQFSPQRFFALDFRPGETNQKLTFIAQKPRLAEFFVEAQVHPDPNQPE